MREQCQKAREKPSKLFWRSLLSTGVFFDLIFMLRILTHAHICKPLSGVMHLIGIPKACHLKSSASVACLRSSCWLIFPRILRGGAYVLCCQLWFFSLWPDHSESRLNTVPHVPSMETQNKQNPRSLSTQRFLIPQILSAFSVPHTVPRSRIQKQENSLKSLPLGCLHALRTCIMWFIPLIWNEFASHRETWDFGT